MLNADFNPLLDEIEVLEAELAIRNFDQLLEELERGPPQLIQPVLQPPLLVNFFNRLKCYILILLIRQNLSLKLQLN